jgi:hypothetical protein
MPMRLDGVLWPMLFSKDVRFFIGVFPVSVVYERLWLDSVNIMAD